MTFEQDNTYLTISLENIEGNLLLERIEGREAMCELFAFRVRILAQDANLNFSQIVDATALVTLELPESGARYLHSIVARAIFLGQDARGYSAYELELRPWLWKLSLNRNSRIFQEMTAPDIIAKVFSDQSQGAHKLSLSSTYNTRNYCVQYNESDFQYVSRLMECEGISYYFEHTAQAHTLVLVDMASSLSSIPGPSSDVAYNRSPHLSGRFGSAVDCFWEQLLVSGQYIVDDYNFETPSTDLETLYNEDSTGMKIYEYPAEFQAKGEGEALARQRLESYMLYRDMLRGTSAHRALVAGGTFTLQGHPRDEVNQNYLLWSVAIQAHYKQGYQNRFEALPSEVALRPPIRTPEPIIPGIQTATVVGESGEEISTDSFARIKVQFHWDQEGQNDENSSCWIRVAQTWTGSGWGAVWVPRIGQEVVVTFLEGDPDRPLVIGSVYNQENTPPLSLPDEKTRSTWKSNSSTGGGGFNEIGFEDKKEEELLWMQAQKDMELTVLNDRTTNVQNDETHTVKNNRTTTIEEGNESLTVTQGDRTLAIQAGKETYSVASTRDITVTGDETHTNEAAFTHKVTGDYTLEVTGSLTLKVTGSITVQTAQSLTLKIGQSGTVEAGQSLTLKAGQSITVQAGQSLTQQAGVSLTSKAGASHNVESGGILGLKGSLVKIN